MNNANQVMNKVKDSDHGKIRIRHGHVSYLDIYEITAFISRVTVNNGKKCWQRIFKTFDKHEYEAKVKELLSSGNYKEEK